MDSVLSTYLFPWKCKVSKEIFGVKLGSGLEVKGRGEEGGLHIREVGNTWSHGRGEGLRVVT